MKRISVLALALLLLLSVSGCQAAPESSAVVGKNDGVFESALKEEAGTSGIPEEEPPSFEYKDEFTSTDGKIEYKINVNNIEYSGNPMPVIQVTPKSFTPEEIHSMSTVLLGNTDFYEFSTELTKSEIEEQIVKWRQASTYEYIAKEYEESERSKSEIETIIQSVMQTRQAILADYEELYKTARETIEPQECQWTFFPLSHYLGSIGSEESESDKKTGHIMATTEIDGLPYRIWATNRDSDDYRIHDFSANLSFGFGLSPEEEGELAKPYGMYSNEKPTEEEVEAVKEKAMELIEEMEIGEWKITSCRAYYNQRYHGYVINIEATPVYSGIEVTKKEQLSSLRSEDEYASNYYYEEIFFMLNKDGRLILFKYTSPHEVVETVNERVAVMTFEEMTERIKSQLSLNALEAYQYYDFAGNGMISKVEMEISGMEFGFSRVRIKDNKRDFYLVPTVTLKGKYTSYNESGEIIDSYPYVEGGTAVQLVLNLVDGSVVNVQNSQ